MKRIIASKKERIKKILGMQGKHNISEIKKSVSESNKILVNDLRKKHPEWTDDKVHSKAKEILERILRES